MKFLMIVSILVVVSTIGVLAYLSHPKFGPKIDFSESIALRTSSNDGASEFRNLEPTSVLAGNQSTASIILGSVLDRPENLAPDTEIPTRKTDLKSLDIDQDTVVWLGHSSYFVQIAGRRILIDPVFSPNAAPIPYANSAFAGTSIYRAEDMPEIDYLLITHNHWDHLDYSSVRALRPTVRDVVCGLGVDQYFRHWGYPHERIHAGDWFDRVVADAGLNIHVLPARHYSGRLLAKNRTLWVAFALESPERRLFFSGDSGYGQHVARISEMFDHFDLAVVDMGQYDARWPAIHMTPEEAADVAETLHAQALMPAHVGKFAIARHAWDEPFERIVQASAGRSYRLVTPMIGEPLRLADSQQAFARWWRGAPRSYAHAQPSGSLPRLQ